MEKKMGYQVYYDSKDLVNEEDWILVVNAKKGDMRLAEQMSDELSGDYKGRNNVLTGCYEKCFGTEGFWVSDHMLFESAYRKNDDTVVVNLTPVAEIPDGYEEGGIDSYEPSDDYESFEIKINPNKRYTIGDILDMLSTSKLEDYAEDYTTEYLQDMKSEESYRHMVEVESRYW